MSKVLGIGIDLISIRHKSFRNKKIVYKYMSNREISLFDKISDRKSRLLYMASLWTIKEAVFKCLINKVSMRSIEVFKNNGSETICNIVNSSDKVMVSVSYYKDLVISNAILVE